MNLIDGKKIRNEILEKVRTEVAALSFVPIFCDVLVGDDPVSAQYVRMKAKTAESVGMKFHNANFPSTIATKDLIKEIQKLNSIKGMCGIIVQLPLPLSVDRRLALDSITPRLDVDFLGSVAGNDFYNGKTEKGFPTAMACMAILDSLNLDIKGKTVAVLGQGELVGKPVSALLRFRGVEPAIITSKTPNKEKIIKEADIIISGIGKGKYITGEMIKKGVVVIDAGTSEGEGGIVGDVDLDSVKDVAGFVSPVPGGVGPVTVAMLLQNVLHVAKNLK